MEDQVHVRDGEAGAGEFLPVKLQRPTDLLRALSEKQLALDEEAGGTAGEVIDLFTLPRVDQVSDQPADFLRREELSRTLALSLRELPEEVLVSPAEKIRLDVFQ